MQDAGGRRLNLLLFTWCAGPHHRSPDLHTRPPMRPPIPFSASPPSPLAHAFACILGRARLSHLDASQRRGVCVCARTYKVARETESAHTAGAMKPTAPPFHAPRPPLHARSDPNSAVTAQGGGAGAAAAVQETQLRRRLAEAEMRLRDMDEEERRIGVLQEQEIAKLECDNAKLRERLEEIRMEECMPPAESHAFQDDTKRQLTGGAPASRAESKLLGSTTLKYQHAKAEVERRRRECAQAERQLTDSRTRLADLRKARKELKGQSVSAEMSAAVRVAAADNYRERIYERLRGLEEQVAREQERFNSIVTEAKQARSDIDALLVSQTSKEKINQYWCDALLGKRREMAYLIEVCNLLCEEREQVVADLTEVQARMTQESDQYEAVFDELTGVQDENAKAQTSNREQLDELRRLIAQTRAEREALEKENRDAKISMERQRCRTVGRRLNDEANQDGSAVGEECSTAAAGDAEHAGDDCDAELRTSESASLFDGDQQQMRMFEDYYRKLSAIVQSDAIEDVAAFMDTAADERYKVFDEVNAIKRNTGALETEKASLMAQLGRGGGVGPSAVSESVQQQLSPAVLATLSEAGTLDTLAMAKDAMEAGKSGCSSVLGASRNDTQERCRRMVDLLEDLGTTRDLVFENQEGQEASATVLAQVVAQVNEVFRGLGCSVGELRALTGMEGVHPTTLLQCLAMIEQRASEYLLAYSRQQQRRLPQAEGAVAALPSRNAARTLLRRSDLAPKTRRNVVAATVRQHALPRSTDPTTRMPTIAALSSDTSGTLDDRVEERPVSMAELKKAVEAKRIIS
ncbi:hypothetical protein, conserved [Leishmania tarentolae]|uniref:ODAD1 central coiled coil region domain-containing protein n=1 Tax=Leishmania tarentolae TaxID=5689 RepID=A0A640K8H7_LEITA|nr:hypothetical protein, conserved [Leishmania tarentolae]